MCVKGCVLNGDKPGIHALCSGYKVFFFKLDYYYYIIIVRFPGFGRQMNEKRNKKEGHAGFYV